MKKFRKVLLSFCLCFVIFALVSCGESGLNSMPKLDESVSSNGGLSVVKGDYIYFVDSYVNASDLKKDDNKQGKVKTNALYRTKLKDGKLDTDKKGNLKSYDLVVSKVVGTENTNMFIFDNYIYYGTPNMQNDRDGKLRTDLIDFCRAKLDGTGVEVIYTTEQYTSGASYNMCKIGGSVYLIVFDGKDIIKVEIKGSIKKPVKLVENVNKMMMAKTTDYAYSKNNQVVGNEGFVYYTREVNDKDGFANPSNKGNVIGKISIADSKSIERMDGKTTYELKLVNKSLVYAYKTVSENKYLYIINDMDNAVKDVQVTKTTVDYTNDYIVPDINGKHQGVIVNLTNGGSDGKTNEYTVWIKDSSDVKKAVVLSESAHTILHCDGHYAYYLDGSKMYRIDITNSDLETNKELVFTETDVDTAYLDFDQNGYIYYFNNYTGDSGKSQKYLKRVDLSNKIQPEEEAVNGEEVETDLGYKTELMGVLKDKHIKVEI